MAIESKNPFMNALGRFTRFDSWVNFFTGMNTGKDKIKQGTPTHIFLTEFEAEELYASDRASKKVVNSIALDSTREWIEYTNLDTDVVKYLLLEEKRLSIKSRFTEAMTFARLYGGAGIWVVANDGREVNEPLDVKNIVSIDNLVVLTRWELWIEATDIENNAASINFGKPNFYRLNPITTGNQVVVKNEGVQQKPIHYTRILRFDGERLPKRKFIENQYWHDSVLSSLFNSLSRFNQTNDAISSIIQDFVKKVMKMKDLASIIDSGGKEKTTERVQLLNEVSSILNTVLIDADTEEFSLQSAQVAGLAELVKTVDNKFVADTGLPHTKVLGESPSGLGATGESEQDDYNEVVRKAQEDDLKDNITRLLFILLHSQPAKALKVNPAYDFKFKPLKIKSDKEIAEIRNIVSQSNERDVRSTILTPDEAALSTYGPDGFSQVIKLLLDRTEIEEDEEIEEEDDDLGIEDTNKEAEGQNEE